MRIHLVLLASLSLAGCGGSTTPPETAGATSAPADTAAAAAPTPTADAAASAAPAAPPPAAPVRTPATLAGAIAGKPFHAVAACVAGAGKDGKVYVEIYDVKDFDVTKTCGMLPPVPDARKIGVYLPWSDGGKLDVATLKASKDPEMFVMATTANPKKMDRKDVGKELKPTGTIEVLKAPKNKGDVGRIKLDLTVGKDKLTGEVDVDVMASGLN
jgi:hypothetical protein